MLFKRNIRNEFYLRSEARDRSVHIQFFGQLHSKQTAVDRGSLLKARILLNFRQLIRRPHLEQCLSYTYLCSNEFDRQTGLLCESRSTTFSGVLLLELFCFVIQFVCVKVSKVSVLCLRILHQFYHCNVFSVSVHVENKLWMGSAMKMCSKQRTIRQQQVLVL